MKTKARKPRRRFLSRTVNVSTCAINDPADSCHVWTCATQPFQVPVAGKNRFLQLERFRIEAPRFFERLVDARHYRLKTEFILDYLSQPALRTRIRRGLLKGEQLHALARCVHYGRLGRLDQRDFERQTGAASCLLRILAAIIYWQIREASTSSTAVSLRSERLSV